MPIHVILGKPGSGKSLYAVSRVIDELANGTRNVVTNLPLHPGRLNEYLQEKYPDRDCRMVQRLRILDDDELREFWRYRGPGIEGVADPIPDELPQFQEFHFKWDESADPESEFVRLQHFKDQWEAKRRARFALIKDRLTALGDMDGKRGVAYFLDEAHIAFNAREWASLGRGCLHYLSQHRKLSDVVWPITQSPGNLDKQFRSVAEDFTVLRNEYTAKYGPFRGRGRFVRRTYLSEPSGNAEPFEKVAFTLDKEGIASCYDTAKGIGVHGSKADIGRRAKGFSIWWAFAGAFVLAGLVGFVPWLLGKGAQRAMTGKAKAVSESAEVSSLSRGFMSAGSAASGASVAPAVPAAAGYAPDSVPFPTGYVVFRGRVTVQMSDGTTRIERWESEDGVRGEVTSIDRNAVYLDRVKLFVRPRPRDTLPLVPVLAPPSEGAGAIGVSAR